MQPKSTRLNSENRDKFIRRVLEDKLPDSAYPEDDRFYNKWKDKIYDHVYGPYVERMNDLPDWFFVTSSQMTVKVMMDDDRTNKITFNLDNKVKRINEESNYYSSDVTLPVLDYEDPVSRDYRVLKQAQADFKQQQRELREQLHRLAYSCNTSGQLYKAWDEAVNYSDCFPYKEPNRHQGADVSQREMDIGITIAKTSVNLPEDY